MGRHVGEWFDGSLGVRVCGMLLHSFVILLQESTYVVADVHARVMIACASACADEVIEVRLFDKCIQSCLLYTLLDFSHYAQISQC